MDDRDNYFLWAYNFDHESFYPGSNVWRFDIITDDAIRIQYQTEEMTINELINQKLRYYFSESVLPNISDVEVLYHGWRKNKYVQGSYSDWNMGMNEKKLIKQFEPYAEEGLYFAGEAFDTYSGFVQGAYHNGIEVAKAIIAADQTL